MAENTEALDKATDAPAAETPPGRVSVGDSVRAAIAKAETPAARTDESAPAKAAEDKPRAPDGKFARKDEPEAPAKPAEQAKAAPETPAEGQEPSAAPEAPKTLVRAPQGLKTELKAEWDKLEPKWQGEIDRLERAAKAGIEKHAGMANVGQSLLAEIQPYEAMIRGAGATPQQAVRELFRTEYQLRTGTPAQKAALLYRLSQHYGIDLNGIAQGIAEGRTPQVDPNVAALQQRLDAMERQRQQEAAQRTNAESAQVSSVIQEFSADPKHEHFEDVRVQMGVLIDSGAAKTLDDAYDQACWANPAIRAKLIQSQTQDAEAKRRADERKAVEAKRAAGGSIRGAPAAPIAAPKGKETVGETLRRVSAQSQGRI